MKRTDTTPTAWDRVKVRAERPAHRPPVAFLGLRPLDRITAFLALQEHQLRGGGAA